jgi:hypothetical protein
LLINKFLNFIKENEKVSVVTLWLLVAYAVALLTYSTFDILLDKSDADISAFGSILSAIAGFSACIVAAYLYSSWQEQKSYDLKKGYIEKLAENVFTIDYLFNFQMSARETFLLKDKEGMASFTSFDSFNEIKISETVISSTNIVGFLKKILKDEKIEPIFEKFSIDAINLLILNLQAIDKSKAFLPQNYEFKQLQINHLCKSKLSLETLKSFESYIDFIKSTEFESAISEYESSFDDLTQELSEKIKPT